MALSAGKVLLGVGCAILLVGGGMLATCAGCVASSIKDASTHEPQQEPNGRWRGGDFGPSAMDDSRTITYQLKALNELQGWPQRVARPRLVAKCAENHTEVYVVMGMPLSPELGKFERYTVRLRMDGSPARREVWSESTDGEAIFSPSPIPLARQIAKSKEMLMEVTPFRSSPQAIIFQVAQFDGPLKEISAACGWKP